LTDELDPKDLQPSSLMCFGCGINNAAGLRIRFYSDGPGKAIARVMLDDRHQGYPGIAHGGVVATMLDEIMGRAAMTEDHHRLMFTAKMEVRYRQPVPLYRPLTLRGRVEKDRGRIAQVVGELLLPDGSIGAESTGTLMLVPPDELKRMDTPEVGWQVYPIEQEK